MGEARIFGTDGLPGNFANTVRWRSRLSLSLRVHPCRCRQQNRSGVNLRSLQRHRLLQAAVVWPTIQISWQGSSLSRYGLRTCCAWKLILRNNNATNRRNGWTNFVGSPAR
jgi:hypothetical protein